MTPALQPSRRTHPQATSDLILAATIVRDAADSIANDETDPQAVASYLRAADRLDEALNSPEISPRRILRASPALTERSGRVRTLVEMIEAEPVEDHARLRLAKLLFRSLIWHPESFPGRRD
jgi:hypothetical protein